MPSDILTLVLAAAVEIHEPWPPLWVLEWSARIMLLAWLFWMGACVGSFLNVVVYRLPRGMNLVYPGSHCPACGHPIRMRDNVPIFGWLLLKGKCRDCSAAISQRYFNVELIVAAIFLLFAACELFGPGRSGTPPGSAARQILTPFQPLAFWCAYGLHVLLATTLIGAALIDWDGIRTHQIFLPVLVAGVVLPLFWPEIRRIPAGVNLAAEPAWWPGLVDGLAGLSIGLLAGLAGGACWWLGSRGRGWPRFESALLLGTVGIVLGWQRTVIVGPGMLILMLMILGVLIFTRAKVTVPLAVVLLLAVFPWLVELDSDFPWLVELDSDVEHTSALGYSDRRGLVAAIVAATAVLWLMAGEVAPPQYFTRRAIDPKPPTPPPPAAPDYSEGPPPSATP